MTAPLGYTRAKTLRDHGIARAWRILHDSAAPLGATELAELAAISRTQSKRLIAAAINAGMMHVAGSVTERSSGPGAVRIPLYALTATAPDDPPALSLDAGEVGAIAGSSVPGERLADLRHARGWSLAETGRHIGVNDVRTVRRYETLPALPPRVAEMVASLETNAG